MKSPVKKLSENLKIDRNVAQLLQACLKLAREEFARILCEVQSKRAALAPIDEGRYPAAAAKSKPTSRVKAPAVNQAESRFVT